MSRLADLASLHGIEPGYHDVWGNWHATPEAAHRALLAAMGVDAPDEAAIEAALADAQRGQWTQVVPPVTVVRRARLRDGIRVQLAQAALARPLAWRIVEESGEEREERFDPFQLATLEDHRQDGLDVRAFTLPLPQDLPEGYHRIVILQGEEAAGEGALVVVPERCFLPPTLAEGARLWGPAVQLYAVASERNAGIGDFTDLRRLALAWGQRGASVVGTNPLHALHPADPEHASPYSPSSRLFLNVLYIDVEGVEDYAGAAQADPAWAARWREESAQLRRGPFVDYGRVCRAKLAALERLFDHFRSNNLGRGTARWRALAQFREAKGPALRRHALHETLREHHGRPWQQWPPEHRDSRNPAVRSFAAEHAERVAFHEYLQWQADRQLAQAQSACRELGMAVGLYADLAISIDRSGSEAWANQGLYALGVSVGAPPDEFNPHGQDWGLPPLVPDRLRQAGYAPLVATLRANMSRAGALRIDHVMGLSRLYWVPAGMSPADGAYVRYPVDEMLGIVALESHRQRCLVIGEDLGTVSDELRRKLAEADVLSYRLLLFERGGDGSFRPPATYPRRALSAWSTHDLPTFAGWWKGEDLDTRQRLGLLDETGLRGQRDDRRRGREALLRALEREGLREGVDASPDAPASEALALAVQTLIARSESAVMVVQLEDALGMAEQANLPGTVEDHPNWRRKLALPLERWMDEPRVQALAKRLAQERGGRHRKRDAPPGLATARIPRSTYRLQLHGEFTFRDATRLLPYLARLGVSHVYCSPYLRARPGSKHGYDIIDHNALNPEIGSDADFAALNAEMKRLGLFQLIDVVPNHMGVMGADNAWWMDVLEHGPASQYADFFDVDWHPPSEHLANKVLLPILGDHYGVELAAGHVALAFEEATGGFAIRYFTHRLPVDPREYPRVLAPAVAELESQGQDRRHTAQSLRSVMESFARLPARESRGEARTAQRREQAAVAKGRLANAARANPAVAAAIARAVESLNGRPEDPASYDALHALLEAQAWRLAYWRVASDEINYRRFFDINDLAALRMEDERVFEATHGFIRRLVAEGHVHGLRIDHPDGLYDPQAYFRRLQETMQPAPYVVVEKIVAPFENLPEEWAVHGTTGYRFANVVNGLFVDSDAEDRLTRIYENFIGERAGFEEITQRARWHILRTALASELTVLTNRLARISRASRNTRDFTFTTLRDGLAEVISNFPVYRTYIDEEASAADRRFVEWAVTRARAGSRAADVGVFDFLRDALLGELPARSPALAAAVRHFARKVQQLTSPVMAKGIEDTALYRYNRLLSLNDVGGDPTEFGFPVAKFHRASANRARVWPHTMLATSTHDNKRSEDVRARIDVVSEMAAGWRLQLRKWTRMNAQRRREVDGRPAPSRNDEYLVYQTLLGSFPEGARGEALAAYRDRVVAYTCKALREAKVHTSWANPDPGYESAVADYVRALLDDSGPNPFLEDFRAALAPVAWAGYLNSLGMVTVKMASPGVPDTYQGNEMWDFSLVDPDNRRPVDYARREQALRELESLGAEPGARVAEVFHDLPHGRAKLYVTWRLLQLRREREELFRHAGYTIVRARGAKARHVVAFARRHDGGCVVAVVPRLTVLLGVAPGALPCGALWEDTRIELPFLEANAPMVDVISGREVWLSNGTIALSTLLDVAPVAVLSL